MFVCMRAHASIPCDICDGIDAGAADIIYVQFQIRMLDVDCANTSVGWNRRGRKRRTK